MNYREALKKALDRDADSSRSLPNTIEVVHQDGSHMTYENAIFEWLDDMWFSVTTEHCGVQVFHSGDIRYVSTIKRERVFTNKEE